VIALAGAIALLYFGRVFLITLVIATILAFILEPLVSVFVRLRLPRGVASFLVCSIGLLLIYLIGLGVYTQVSVLLDDMPNYSQRVNTMIDRAAQRLEEVEKRVYDMLVPRRIQEREKEAAAAAAAAAAAQQQAKKTRRRAAEPPPPPLPEPVQEVRIRPEPTPLINYVYAYLTSFYNVLLMASFVPFLVYFMLSWRDHIRRSFLQLFEGQARLVAGKTWHGIADVARAYVVGNFMLGLLLSFASWLFFIGMNLPYALLVAPLSGFLSLVPYVGLPLAVIPPYLAALAVYDSLTQFLIIGVVVAFFHLIALNLLYPKMVGSRVHLNPLVVTVALMFWGTVWGGIGLVLAIPITAAIKAVCDNVAELRPYGRFLGD
jgi:predicted PurR-regulated permease PerM